MDNIGVLLEYWHALTVTLPIWVQQTGGEFSCAFPVIHHWQSYLAQASFETRVLLLQATAIYTGSEQQVQSDWV